jgi:hypothetical protein
MSCPCRSARGAGDPSGHNNQVRTAGRCWCWCHPQNEANRTRPASLGHQPEPCTGHAPRCQVGSCADSPTDARPATYLLPQSDGRGAYTWALVCESHAIGWWEPDDPVRLNIRYQLVRLP